MVRLSFVGLVLWVVGKVACAQPLLTSSSEEIIIDADEVECQPQQNTCKARGKAHVQRGELHLYAETIEVFSTKTAQGKQELQTILAFQNVRLVSPRETATGNKAEYLRAEEKLTLWGDPVLMQTAQETLTARDYIIFYRLENRAVAGDRVTFLTAQHTLEADHVTAFLASQGKQKFALKTVEALGNVVISTAKERAEGDRAIYSAETQKAHLLGKVRLHREQNVAFGEEVEVNVATGVSILKGGKALQRVRVILYPDRLEKESVKNGQHESHR